MDAPPPRYRIVERGRRLEVIDTWAKRAPPTVAPAPANPPIARQAIPPKPFTVGEGDRFFATIARLACLNATDAEGRPILSTGRTFDDKAPRTFVLGEQGQRRLAVSVLIAAFVLLAIAGMASDSWVFALILPIVAVLGVATKGRPLVTWWLDGFAALDGR